jgi:polysaccharide biosynthesis/export protein
MRYKGISVCTSILLMLLGASAQAQEPAKTEPQATSLEQYPEYGVGPGDVLSLHVFGLKELDQSLKVSNSGKINVPHVGVLPVAGMTVAQIEDELSKKLRDLQLVVDPWVRVQVTEYNAQPVFIVGEVTTPGQFMISGEMRLLDAITKAGGFSSGAGLEGYLIRRQGFSRSIVQASVAFDPAKSAAAAAPAATTATGAGTPAPGATAAAADSQRTVINIRDLKEGRRSDLNVRLQGGDVFYVPRRIQKNIYVVGEVLFPGSYGLPQFYDHLTAGKAVAYAGGILKTAKSGKGFIMRRDATGAAQEIPFDFIAITKGEKPDIPIRPDDMIYVPRSVARTIGIAMLTLFAHLTQQFMIF